MKPGLICHVLNAGDDLCVFFFPVEVGDEQESEESGEEEGEEEGTESDLVRPTIITQPNNCSVINLISHHLFEIVSASVCLRARSLV